MLPMGVDDHEGRKLVASEILECAEKGHGTVRDLTLAGRAVAIRLHGLNRAAGPKTRPPPTTFATNRPHL
jgi:hypothetical protein